MKLKLGDNFTAISGKSRGVQYSSTRFGTVISISGRKLKSAFLTSIGQQTSFGQLSTAWRSLSDATREAWNLAVYGYPFTDVFGVIHYPSGFNLYMSIGGTPPPPAAMLQESGFLLLLESGDKILL